MRTLPQKQCQRRSRPLKWLSSEGRPKIEWYRALEIHLMAALPLIYNSETVYGSSLPCPRPRKDTERLVTAPGWRIHRLRGSISRDGRAANPPSIWSIAGILLARRPLNIKKWRITNKACWPRELQLKIKRLITMARMLLHNRMLARCSHWKRRRPTSLGRSGPPSALWTHYSPSLCLARHRASINSCSSETDWELEMGL